MNKYALIILLNVIINFRLSAQEKKSIYVDDKSDYVVLLDKSFKTLSKFNDNIETDVFVKSDDTIFYFTILISKIYNSEFINKNLVNNTDYENYFLDSCNCSIILKELVVYNNIQTLRYKVRTIKDSKNFLAFNDSFISNNILYNVLFLTFEESFDENISKYDEIMNNFLINGRVTIDGSDNK